MVPEVVEDGERDAVGWAGAYVLTRPRRYRAWVYGALALAALLPFLASVFGLARGVEWLVFDLGLGTVRGAFWFGWTLGAMQVVFGRSSGRGFWAENGGVEP